MNLRQVFGTAVGSTLLAAAAAAAADCGGTLGTSRTLMLERTGAAYDRFQHAALPLAPREVVISCTASATRASPACPRPGNWPT